MPDRAQGCGVGIAGLGVYLPEQVRTNDFFPQVADPFLEAVDQSAGLSRHDVWNRQPFRGAVQRRVIDEQMASSDLERLACVDALASAKLAASQIDLLIGYSQVSDHAGPGNHGRVAGQLGLPLHATSFTLDSGCASFLTHLNTAARLIEGGDHQRALLYQSSAISRVQDPDSTAAPLMGDGAVAQVIAAVEPGFGWMGKVQLTRGDLCDGLVLAPQTSGRWYDASRGSAFRVSSPDRRAAVRMGADSVTFAKEACDLVLSRCGFQPPDIDFFVASQPTVWFSEACAEAIGIPEGRVVPPADHFQRYGHLLAASAPLNLWVAWSTGRLRRGDLVLVYSPGVGFTQAATLIRWWLEPSSAR